MAIFYYLLSKTAIVKVITWQKFKADKFNLTKNHTGTHQTQEYKKLHDTPCRHPQETKRNAPTSICRLGKVNKTQVKVFWVGEQKEEV